MRAYFALMAHSVRTQPTGHRSLARFGRAVLFAAHRYSSFTLASRVLAMRAMKGGRMPRSFTLAVAATILVIGVAALGSQAHPGFDGAWLMDLTRSESAAQGADASPRQHVRLDIAQRPAVMTITRTVDGVPEKIDYTFGDVDRSAVGTRGTSDPKVAVEQASARWDGDKLVTVTVYRVNGMATKKTETRTLSADKREMIVRTELQMQHGYESSDGRGPAGHAFAQDVFVRADGTER
jgi:hypothetical protein